MFSIGTIGEEEEDRLPDRDNSLWKWISLAHTPYYLLKVVSSAPIDKATSLAFLSLDDVGKESLDGEPRPGA